MEDQGLGEGDGGRANKIQTFVFLDIEATGLISADTRILELALVAVSRHDLLAMKPGRDAANTNHATANTNHATDNNGDTNGTTVKCEEEMKPKQITFMDNDGFLLTKAIHDDSGMVTTNTTPSKECGAATNYPPDNTRTPDAVEGVGGTGKGVKRKHGAPALPRVLHKYTRLYYPRKLISPRLEEVTGLSNELLHTLPGFSRASAEAIALFLDLPEPVCLVAHNGSRYDFPLLKAELHNVDVIQKFGHIQCVDTLSAIKDIDAIQKKEVELKEITEITELAESFSFDEMYDEMMEAGPSSKRSRYESLGEEMMSLENGHTGSRPANQPLLQTSFDPHLTPVKNLMNVRGNKTPKTPAKPVNPPEGPVTPLAGTSAPGTPGWNVDSLTATKNVRRALSYGSPKKKWDGTRPYNQGNIYKRLFSEDFDAHRAESDCLALLQICGHYGDAFVQWADTFHQKFSGVKPMWIKRKSFQLDADGQT